MNWAQHLEKASEILQNIEDLTDPKAHARLTAAGMLGMGPRVSSQDVLAAAIMAVAHAQIAAVDLAAEQQATTLTGRP